MMQSYALESIMLRKSLIIIFLFIAGILYSQESQDPPVSIPIIKAIANNDIKTLQKLIEDGADVNVKDAEGNTPLIWGALLGFDKIVEELLSNGAGNGKSPRNVLLS